MNNTLKKVFTIKICFIKTMLFIILSPSVLMQNATAASGMNTAEIVAATTQGTLACLKFSPVGICLWLKCAGPICSVSTSIKNKHFLPDVTVQSYESAYQQPWTETKDMNKALQADSNSSVVRQLLKTATSGAIEGSINGGSSNPRHTHQKTNLKFRYVDAYGNPALNAMENMLKNSKGCQSTATMLVPYFISNLDFINWRFGISEFFYPQSYDVVTGQSDLRDGIMNNYGPIYPRQGFIDQYDELKAAVVTAFRAMHIITRSAQPHIYLPIHQEEEDGYWPPKPLEHDDPDTGQWQMLHPKLDTNCALFPYEANPGLNRRSKENGYIWNLWRPYKCCEKQGNILIFHSG